MQLRNAYFRWQTGLIYTRKVYQPDGYIYNPNNIIAIIAFRPCPATLFGIAPFNVPVSVEQELLGYSEADDCFNTFKTF